jgi:aerobic-type carbon monoxide dehydrogenase small subunit (CoxS/CutS family)
VIVRTSVNGVAVEREVEPRLLLSDFLRHSLNLTATHVGCEHGVCGACNVLLDGRAVRACLLFAVQADGHAIVTAEGLGTPDAPHPAQAAFLEEGALQCGFCTPGFLISLAELLPELEGLDDADLRKALSGNICRCTGYQAIVAAAREAAR